MGHPLCAPPTPQPVCARQNFLGKSDCVFSVSFGGEIGDFSCALLRHPDA